MTDEPNEAIKRLNEYAEQRIKDDLARAALAAKVEADCAELNRMLYRVNEAGELYRVVPD